MTCHAVRLFPARSRDKAFSLVEVVIALGIVGFSIVAIFSLFSVGLKNALESRRETRAAYLAEQIVGDLRSSPFSNATILYKKSDGELADLTSFDMGSASTHVLACDGQNNVLKVLSPSDYNSGVTDSGVEYLIQIKVEPTAFDGLSQVSVEVSTPAVVRLNGRSRYGFITMIGDRQ